MQRKREEAAKKRYKRKAIAPRLCTDEVMSRLKLKEHQNTYAEAMSKYGLERGIEGSTAKHVSTSKYYRDLIEPQGANPRNGENTPRRANQKDLQDVPASSRDLANGEVVQGDRLRHRPNHQTPKDGTSTFQ